MRALTLVQPWAHAIVYLGKDIENRSWKPSPDNVGHRIAIHAGNKRSRPDIDALIEEGSVLASEQILSGAIVGTALLFGWVTDWGEHSDTLTAAAAAAALRSPWYIAGHVGWVLREPRALREPILCRGALGLWRAPYVGESALVPALR
jgi:hypothetical protein